MAIVPLFDGIISDDEESNLLSSSSMHSISLISGLH